MNRPASAKPIRFTYRGVSRTLSPELSLRLRRFAEQGGCTVMEAVRAILDMAVVYPSPSGFLFLSGKC